MPSPRQNAFFDELLSTREFPAGTDATALKDQFSKLSQDAGSQWIEKAIALPKKDNAEGDNTPPPF